MSFLKRTALTVPALKRIFDQRNRLLAEAFILRFENSTLQDQITGQADESKALRNEILRLQDEPHGPLQGVAREKLNAIGYALQENRLFLID